MNLKKMLFVGLHYVNKSSVNTNHSAGHNSRKTW